MNQTKDIYLMQNILNIIDFYLKIESKLIELVLKISIYCILGNKPFEKWIL